MKKKRFLFPPPDLTPSEACRIWHEKMVAEYQLTSHIVSIVLSKWLRDADLNRVKIESMALTTEVHHRLFDHGCVIKRRSDGALFILGQPYNTVFSLERDPYVAAWRDLGSEVICSEDSGWFPPCTVTLMIGEPKHKVSKSGTKL